MEASQGCLVARKYLTVHGSFENKCPTCKIKIWGISKERFFEGKGVIDTGFNGYLQIPSISGFPLGLVLIGTQTSTIANGDRATSLSCIGTAKIGTSEVMTEISVGAGDDILIGTQLLAKMGYSLDVSFVEELVKLTKK